MSTITTTEDDVVSTLTAQLANVQNALRRERHSLMARVALIDQALGTQPIKPAKAPKAPRAPRAGSVPDAIVASFVAFGPGYKLTIREIQKELPSLPPKTVEATVRTMAADGRLAKDDQTPRHFWTPVDSSELSPTPARSPGETKNNGAARPQPQPSPKG
jgi:hypothetical protein